MVPTLLLLSAILWAIGRAAQRHRLRVLTVAAAGQTGRVTLSGVARAELPQLAPISGTACAYWEAEAWDSRPRRSRVPMALDVAAVILLWLEAPGGERTPILLHGVEWSWNPSEELRVAATSLTGRAYDFVQRCGLDHEVVPYRVVERRIDDGAAIHAMGTLATVADVLPLLDELAAAPISNPMAFWRHVRRPPDSKPLMPADCASALRSRFASSDHVLWSARSSLLIGTGDRSGLATRLQWVVLICKVGSAMLAVVALAMFLFAVAAW